MMNKRNIYILGWLTLAACTPFEGVNPDGTDGDGNLPPVALEIGKVQMPGVYHEKGTNAGTRSAETSSAETSNAVTRNAETRATTYTTYTGNIGFFRQALSGNNGYTAVNNRKGELVTRTINGTATTYQAWVPTDDDATTKTDSIWLKETEATLAVYAPYDAALYNASHPGKLTLTPGLLTGTDTEKAKKFIYAKTFKANRQNAHQATLQLEHLYTRLTLVVKRQSYYLDQAVLSRLSLQSSPQGVFINPTMTCRYNLFSANPATAYEHDAPLATDFTIADVAATIPTVGNPTQNASVLATIDLLMAPTDLSALKYLLLSLTVDGQVMKTALAPTHFASTPDDVSTAKLEAGKHYTVNLILTPKLMEVAEVTVEDWQQVSSDRLDAPHDHEPGIRVMKENNTLCNDKADKEKLERLIWAEGNLEGTGNYPLYAWTEEQTSYGYYYPWAGIQGDRDPCTMLDRTKYGIDWRLPSYDELDTLLRCGRPGDLTTKTGERVNGYWCMDWGRGVFLPFAGTADLTYNEYRFATAPDVIPDVKEATYWTNESLTYIYFDTSDHINRGMSKTYGASVRCVKEVPTTP